MSWQVDFKLVPSGPEGPLQLGYWVFGIGDEAVELERPWGAVGGNPYPNLLRAVRELAAGAESSGFSWHLEPGEYRWAFTRRGDEVDVQVTDWSGSFGEPLLTKSCRLRELVKAVTSALDSVEGNEDVAFLRSWLQRH